jgi:hypothetical protein
MTGTSIEPKLCMKLEKLSILTIVLALFSLGEITASAQQSNGSLSITGSVSPALRLSLSNQWQSYSSSTSVNVEATGADSVIIRVSGEGQTVEPHLVIPIELRTNVGYTLKATLISSEGCSPVVTASVSSLQASGPLVMQGVVEAAKSIRASSLSQIGQSSVLLRGTRVSARGGFTSSSNALLANLNLDLSQAGANCRWSTLIRISLEQ